MSMRGVACAAFFLCAYGADAAACSCVKRSLQERLDDAEVVALVRIDATRTSPDWVAQAANDFPSYEARPVLADLTLVETLKGDASGIETLATGFGGGDCGVNLIAGFDMLVSGTPQAGVLEVGFCGEYRILGPRSVLRWPEPPALHARDAAYLHAVRGYLLEGTPLHACAGFQDRPWSTPGEDAAHQAECRAWIETFEDSRDDG